MWMDVSSPMNILDFEWFWPVPTWQCIVEDPSSMLVVFHPGDGRPFRAALKQPLVTCCGRLGLRSSSWSSLLCKVRRIRCPVPTSRMIGRSLCWSARRPTNQVNLWGWKTNTAWFDPSSRGDGWPCQAPDCPPVLSSWRRHPRHHQSIASLCPLRLATWKQLLEPWDRPQLHGSDENNLLDSLSLDLVDPRQFPVCRWFSRL